MSVRFAIVGCGYVANRHAEHVRRPPRAELVGAFDLDPERARSLCASYGGRPAASLEELLRGEADVVTVCTPNGLHCEGAVAALSHGRRVLVEKPMALSVRECEEMIAAAQRHGRRLLVVTQNRFNAPVRAVKQLLDARPGLHACRRGLDLLSSGQ
jgi:predicted dehydrogenase